MLEENTLPDPKEGMIRVSCSLTVYRHRQHAVAGSIKTGTF